MDTSNVKLIEWDEVPNGHRVWIREKGHPEYKWISANKGASSGGLFIGGLGVDESDFEFAAAEQQPGEWAAELASLRFQISEISARAAYKAVVLLDDPDGNTTRLKTVVVSGSPDEVRIHVVRPHAEDERSSDDPLTAARLDSMRKRWKDTESELARLRDGLAALEQRVIAAVDRVEQAVLPDTYSEGPDIISRDSVRASVRAALREGR